MFWRSALLSKVAGSPFPKDNLRLKVDQAGGIGRLGDAALSTDYSP